MGNLQYWKRIQPKTSSTIHRDVNYYKMMSAEWKSKHKTVWEKYLNYIYVRISTICIEKSNQQTVEYKIICSSLIFEHLNKWYFRGETIYVNRKRTAKKNIFLRTTDPILFTIFFIDRYILIGISQPFQFFRNKKKLLKLWK